MARKKQTFDPHALTREVVSATHEVVTVPFRLRTYRVIRKILIIFIAVSIVNVVFANVFYTPKMYRILRENSELVFKYRLLQDKIRAEQRKLDEIHHRDNFVYRALFSADTLNIGGIYTPYPASKYAALAGDEYAPLMIGTWQQLDAFGRQLYRTSVSFDELQILAKNKENMSTAIPAIWPIDRQALRRGIEPFGYRNHPIYHRRILHKGIDLAANIGNNVYATGDATVQSTDLGQPRRGYGKQILLNHQYGYQTRYAHLSQIFVKPGEKVVRGQLIGKVGNTGGVTGPPPALRGDSHGTGRQSDQLFQPQYDQRGVRAPDGTDAGAQPRHLRRITWQEPADRSNTPHRARPNRRRSASRFTCWCGSAQPSSTTSGFRSSSTRPSNTSSSTPPIS